MWTGLRDLPLTENVAEVTQQDSGGSLLAGDSSLMLPAQHFLGTHHVRGNPQTMRDTQGGESRPRRQPASGTRCSREAAFRWARGPDSTQQRAAVPAAPCCALPPSLPTPSLSQVWHSAYGHSNGAPILIFSILCNMGDFPGGPVIRAWHFHCHRPGFNPWSRN